MFPFLAGRLTRTPFESVYFARSLVENNLAAVLDAGLFKASIKTFPADLARVISSYSSVSWQIFPVRELK